MNLKAVHRFRRAGRLGSHARSESLARRRRDSSAMRCSSVRVMRKMLRMCV